MVPSFFNGLQTFQTGMTRLVSGISESLPSRALVGLKTQIRVLDGACRLVLPLRGRGPGWEDTAIRLQNELSRAEQALAQRHAEALFSNAVLSRLVFSTPFGRRHESLSHREDVFRKIEREGMDGYVDLLVAAINQHWAPVLTWETLRGGYLPEASVYDELDDCHGPSVAIIVGVLSAIETDAHVERRFRARWNSFSPLHPLDSVRERIDVIAARYQREFRLQSLL
jgi:hypothetical protein